MSKVLISDSLSPQAIAVLKEAGIDVDVKIDLSEADLISIIAEYDGIAIRSATKLNAKVLAAATRLKVIGRAGIGVDNIDLPAATAQKIQVMNTPFGNSTATAELAITHLMAVARQLGSANSTTHAGKWLKNKYMGVEVTGKTLGVIGCGNIGSIVAERAQGLKMKVIAYDPSLDLERARNLGVDKVELDELLRDADFITLHTPMTPQTKYILNKDTLAKTKKGVRIVNCARGGLIHEGDLKAAIESGHVAGAALDVLEVEPGKENALFGMEQLTMTPHLGASTVEAQENVALQVAEQIADYLKTGAVVNAVNKL